MDFQIYLLYPVILLPILGALLCLAAPAAARGIGIATSVLTIGALIAVTVFFYQSGPSEGEGHFRLVNALPVYPELGLSFKTGVDGLSLVVLWLSAIVMLAAVGVSPKKVEGGSAGVYYSCVLFIAAAAIGAFASLDMFFFYAFHELALIPTFIMIGIWGSGDRPARLAVAWKVTLYLAAGGFILLLGILALYWNVQLPGGQSSFDMVALLNDGQILKESQSWIFGVLLLGFGILVGLFPFHSWAPAAYATAPAPVTMLHAGVLKKFGVYGLLRLSVPLLPEGMQAYGTVLQVLLIGNIIFIGLATIAQKRLDMMLGYSSIMHMGYIFLGILSLNAIGLGGAGLLIFAHGLSIALLFALSGQLRDRTQTLHFDQLGGIAQRLPFVAVMFGLAAFASIGLPGFANFASEVMIFFGAFQKGFSMDGFASFQITVLLALWGVVISAVYMLRAYKRTFFGELPKRWDDLGHDPQPASGPRRIRFGWLQFSTIILIAGLLVTGFVPRLILQPLSDYTRTIAVPAADPENTEAEETAAAEGERTLDAPELATASSIE